MGNAKKLDLLTVTVDICDKRLDTQIECIRMLNNRICELEGRLAKLESELDQEQQVNNNNLLGALPPSLLNNNLPGALHAEN